MCKSSFCLFWICYAIISLKFFQTFFFLFLWDSNYICLALLWKLTQKSLWICYSFFSFIFPFYSDCLTSIDQCSHALFSYAFLNFTLQIFHFYKLKVFSNPELSKSIGSIFPTVFSICSCLCQDGYSWNMSSYHYYCICYHL